MWKRPNLIWRISSVSVRQGPSRSIIPREPYVSSLCPQVSENWRIRRFLFIPDPILFMPDPKYSYRILSFYPYRILFHLCRIRNTHTGSFFIHAESKFTELLLTIPESSNIIVNWLLVWELFVPGLKTDEWNWVTDQFHENKKITGSNIFKRINISLFFIEAKL